MAIEEFSLIDFSDNGFFLLFFKFSKELSRLLPVSPGPLQQHFYLVVNANVDIEIIPPNHQPSRAKL